jgi:HlyD family secretion protein
MTATVHLNGTRVDGVRLPNSALSFRPPETVLEAAGEPADLRARPVEAAAVGVDREIWRYDGARLIPVAVRVGVTDGTWTELVAGSIHDGDALVVSAELK